MRPAAPAAYTTALPPPGDRRCDITVFGCTGNAGRSVAFHVVRSAAASSKPISVGLAGRSRDRVEKVLSGIFSELEGVSADDVDVHVLIADASDAPSMLSMAQSSRVVAACAGPYGRYGEAAVVACIEGRAHYLDITGEVPWVARMANEYGSAAEEAGVALLPFSGYDCVPAELGMAMAGAALEEHCGEGSARMATLNLAFRNKGGGFPRGTLETIMDSFEGKTPDRKDGDARFYRKEYKSTVKNALSPVNLIRPKWSDQAGTYTGPNLMTSVNVPVLCRSAPTLGFSGDLVISDRSIVSGRASIMNGWGLIPTVIYTGVLVAGGLSMALPPFRWWLKRKLRTYSYGGDRRGKIFLHAQALPAPAFGAGKWGGPSATARCMYPGDAGIYATGLFAAAVAHALLDATSAGSGLQAPLAGFHSPVAALHRCGGGLLVRRLRDIGAEIEVRVVPSEGAEEMLVDATELRSRL